MSVLSSAQVTLAWSAGILATVRYYQLAAPTAATPAVPTSSSSLGSWTETEPTADVTKVLWTCERTVYADGTESWSKASKSTSYEAAKDAKSTATAAQQAVDNVSASVSRLDDGLASEVKARTRTDEGVTDLQTQVHQRFDGIDVTLGKLGELGGKVSSWFDFDADASGNPQLTMGSSSSPIKGVYTNSGLEYRDRSGTALLGLDGSTSTTTAQHMQAQDVGMGGWAWVPTMDGAHLSLLWRG